MIYTSYFGNFKKLPDTVTPIAICGSTPEWWTGLCYKKLAPSWSIWSEWKYQHHDNDIYTARFNEERLGKLWADDVVFDLMTLAGDKAPCLLCYEKPGEFCHRHLVADWLTRHLYTTVELQPDTIICR